MRSREFKKIFDRVAQERGFEKAYGGFFMESDECILVIDLQKSNYSDCYEMNLKIFIQDLFNKRYRKSKHLVKKNLGTVFRRQPPQFNEIFNFDIEMDDLVRESRLKTFFDEFIKPFSDKALSKHGIKKLEASGELFLTTSIKKELEYL